MNATDTTVVVITGAAPLDRRAVAAIPRDATIIAADGGLDHARAAGLDADRPRRRPRLDLGDRPGLGVGAHRGRPPPVDKAATDTELAVAHAATLAPQRILLLAGQGDRLDHAVAALGALGAPELAPAGSLEAWWGSDQLHVVHGRVTVELDLPVGTIFSVLAMHGPCAGVTVERRPLAADGDHDPAARRARREQPGRRAAGRRRRRRRHRHRGRPRSGVVNARRIAGGGMWARRRRMRRRRRWA